MSKEEMIKELGSLIDKKLVVYEHDDVLPIHLKANSLEEMKNKLVEFFKNGFCDCFLVTHDEYLKIKEDIES